MRHILLIYRNLPAGAVDVEFGEPGEWLGGAVLAPGFVVRVRGGIPVITASAGLLAGFCLIDCETTERAVEIAVRAARPWVFEVRPVMAPGGMEMW